MSIKTPSVKALIYIIPALIAAILSFLVLIVVSEYSMKYTNISVESIQLVCAFISFIGILDCIRKKFNFFFLKIMAEGLTCFILGELYLVLHIYIKGYEQTGSFSISDLSWIGFYIFLLSACSGFFNQAADFKDKIFRKINIISLIAPLLIIGASITLYLSGDNLFYMIIYCIPTGFLSYFTLRNILVSLGKNKILREFRKYNIVVGMILIIDNLACLAFNFGFEDAVYICKFCFALLLLAITPAVYKGVQKWPR